MDESLTSPSGDEALRAELELARRLLEDLYPGGSMKLRVGALPALLPPEFPLPEGARVVGSMERGGQMAQGIIEAPQPVEDARAFYAERLPALGWEANDFMRAGGFVMGPMHAMDRYVSRERGKMVALTYVERAEGGVTVRLAVMAAPPEEAMRGPGPQNMRLQSSIPQLTAPQGATPQSGGGGGSGGDSWWSHARMTAALDLDQVMAHFDRQLTIGGWSRVEGGATRHAGWSLWSLEVERRAYLGVFSAIQVPDQADLYLLQARVEASAPMQSGGMGATSYAPMTSGGAHGWSVTSAVSMRVESQQKPGDAGEGGDTQAGADRTP